MIKQTTRIGLLMGAALMLVWSAAAEQASVPKHLEHAKTAFVKKDLKAAGHDLRAASEEMEKVARKSAGATKEGLEASGRELKTLAEDVERGSVKEAKRIDDAAGRALHALAHERFVAATDAWAKKDAKATGKALKESADFLEAGAKVVDRDAKASTKEAAKVSRGIAGKLVRGMGWTTEEVGKGMDSFGKELKDFGERAKSRS